MAKISIVIPVYNVAPYLRACLRSVMDAAQEVKRVGEGVGVEWRVEVICVDDGSTDGSGEILDEFFHHSTPTPSLYTYKILHQQNLGVSAARNRGMDEASGDWVLFVDGDDVMRSGWLSVVEEALAAHPDVEAVQFGMRMFEDDQLPAWSGEMGSAATRHELVREIEPKLWRTAFYCMAYSRKALKGIRFPSYVRGEDRLFFLSFMDRVRVVCRLEAELYGYRQRSGSAMNSSYTIEKLRSELWPSEQVLLWRNSARSYPRAMWRRLGQDLTEWYAERFFSCRGDLQKRVWSDWRQALLDLRQVGELSTYQRFVLRLFAVWPCKGTAFLLFYVPQWLKRHGIHR